MEDITYRPLVAIKQMRLGPTCPDKEDTDILASAVYARPKIEITDSPEHAIKKRTNKPKTNKFKSRTRTHLTARYLLNSNHDDRQHAPNPQIHSKSRAAAVNGPRSARYRLCHGAVSSGEPDAVVWRTEPIRLDHGQTVVSRWLWRVVD